MRISLISFLIVIFITSCFSYPKTNRRHHLVQAEYQKNEIIIVKDAIICANVGSLLYNEKIEINRDSVLQVFINSFQKLPAEFLIRRGEAYCNLNFIVNRRVKYRRLNFSELYSLIGNDTNSVLIPIINYNYQTLKNMYITSTGAVGGEGIDKNVIIDLAILIFRKKELVYFKSRVFFSTPEIVYRYNESIDFSIKQENIDTLVQLTMKDYLERMK